MKVTNISCEQFAGVQNRDVSLQGGINVIYGKNETGKSTLVNLLSRTLFQKAKIDGRSDKDFPNLYYPGVKKNSTFKGDYADGKVTFETDKGTYTLKKEWGKDARCKLSMPNGDTLRNQSDIDKALRDALQYSEGVYNDMLFSSQRNTDMALQTILDATKKTDAKQQITDVVSQAFAESDGISMDAIEQKINDKISELKGKGNHWDIYRQEPVRKMGGGRWSNELGGVLTAYYAWDDAKKVIDQKLNWENAVEVAENDFKAKDAAVTPAENEYNKFNGYAGLLKSQAARRQLIETKKNTLSRITMASSDWPKLEDDIIKAKALQAEKKNRDLQDKYNEAKKIMGDIRTLKTQFADRAVPTDEEIDQVDNTQWELNKLEGKLRGMNLIAAIHMLGGHSLEITSLRTGEKVQLRGELASITEAVKITVPGVMEMKLSPADVDASAVERQIAEYRNTIDGIFAKYHVDSRKALSDLAKSIKDRDEQINDKNRTLSSILGSTKYEELEAAVKAITAPVRPAREIDGDIYTICRGTDIDRFITEKETIVNSYRNEYGSKIELSEKITVLKSEIEKERAALGEADNIPIEYRDIADPDKYLSGLKNRLEDKRKARENALTAQAKAKSDLENYEKNISGDPTENLERAERVLNEKKELLNHWQHIKEVFDGLKADMHNNPMEDIAKSFTDYLGLISDGKVSGEFPDQSKLDMKIYSGNNLLDYSKLSEGTKETVSLAFRLAVLDHLFPEGGGIIVFDDPLTDMDAERAEQSCRLIKKCAERHQVIFLTCREDYIDQLGGNLIRF